MSFDFELDLECINQFVEPLIASNCLLLELGLILIVPGLVRPLRLVTGAVS